MLPINEILSAINQIFEAGIAITAFSLFIRSLSFNLRDRVSRSFAVILACVMVIFSGEAVSGAVNGIDVLEFWLKYQWIGILFLPAALQHFSDALLATTGRPSRGRRKRVVLASYVFSFLLAVALVFGYVLGPIQLSSEQYPQASSTLVSTAFTFYYSGSTLIAGVGIWRAYKRTKLRVSRRRITYLLVGALFLSLGAYPYMQVGAASSFRYSIFFLPIVIVGNIGIFLCLLLMAYAVAFFGVAWPDRIVRTRLLKWVLRGPMVVFLMLFFITSTNHLLSFLNAPYMVAIPIISAVTVLFSEHLITLLYPMIEQRILNYGDTNQFQLLQSLTEKLITTGDLKQFLEANLAAICDQFQVTEGFVAGKTENIWEIVVDAGNIKDFELEGLDQHLLHKVKSNGSSTFFGLGNYWLYPLFSSLDNEIIGIIGVRKKDENQLDESLIEPFKVLGQRAAMALEDRRLQRKVFLGLEDLGPKIELIQRLRAAFQYDQSDIFRDIDQDKIPEDISPWVKDALSHYWGGPKLTDSPLMEFRIVQSALNEYDGNAANALRAILKNAVNQVKPEGDREFSSEWILYNILEMKFLEGRKVRDIARRLALSEADLYRKQRIAIENVANAIIEMEMKARD